jgi:hypothetical protein
MNPDPAKEADFDRRRQPLEDALFKEMAACLPGDWSTGALELDVENPDPGRSFSITPLLRNPATRQGISALPHSLMQLVGRLHVFCRDQGKPWKAATFVITFHPPTPGQPRRLYLAQSYYVNAPAAPARGGKPRPGMN